MDDSLTVVGHEADQRGVPLFHNLRGGCSTRVHEDLSDAIVELLNAFVGDPAVLSFVCSLVRFHTESLGEYCSPIVRVLGRATEDGPGRLTSELSEPSHIPLRHNLSVLVSRT